MGLNGGGEILFIKIFKATGLDDSKLQIRFAFKKHYVIIQNMSVQCFNSGFDFTSRMFKMNTL